MNVPSPRIISSAISLLFSLAVLGGCAEQKFAVKDAAPVEMAGSTTLQSIKVSEDASRMEVVADKPLVFTYYKTSDPPRALIDLSQTVPGAYSQPIDVNNGNIKRIEVTKHEYSGGFFSRIEILLAQDVDLSVSTNPEDKRTLVVVFPPAAVKAPVATSPSPTGEQAKPADAQPKNETAVKSEAAVIKEHDLKTEEIKSVAVVGAEPTTEAKPVQGETKSAEAPAENKSAEKSEKLAAVVPVATAPKAEDMEAKGTPESKPRETPRPRVVTALNVGKDGIDILVDGGVDEYNAFTLTNPNRLVVDISKAKSGISAKSVAVDSFGVSRARVGLAAGKVRIVFDKPKEPVKPYYVAKTDTGLRVLFGAAAVAATEKSLTETVSAAATPTTGEAAKSSSPTTQPASPSAAATVASAPESTTVVTGGTQARPTEVAPVVSPATETKQEAVSQTTTAPVAGAQPHTEGPQSVKTGEATPSLQKGLVAVEVVKDGVELVISGTMDRYANFRMSDPDRLVVDIFGVRNRVDKSSVDINSFGIGRARIGSVADKVRIVLDTAKGTLPPYQVVKSDRGLRIDFAPVATKAAPVETPAPVKESVNVEKASPSRGGPAVVDSIDFQVMDGYSRIAVKVSGECSVGKPAKVRDGLSLTLKKCALPRKLQRMLDTGSFMSVVRTVTPYAVRTKGGEDTRILVKLRAAAPYSVKQENGIIYWDIENSRVPEAKKMPAGGAVKQLAAEVPAQTDEAEIVTKIEEVPAVKSAAGGDSGEVKKTYTGRKVTLEFSDADIRKIFQLIAEVSNLNFLIADDVSGTISLKLVNVPWDQALEVILESKGLEMKREGNIVQIKPKGKFKSMAEADLEARRAREKQMELHDQVFEISYAAAGEIAGQLNNLKSMHDSVSVSVDARTNRVIVRDVQPSIDKMRDLIKTLDVPEKQVMIEARIVEATTTFARDMGVQWTLNYTDGSASILGINNLTTSLGGIVSTTLPAGNLGGISTGLAFGRLMNNIQLDMRLSAAATSGLVKIISTPKVVTLNNKAAKISQGQSIPYQTTSAEGTKTEFVQAALTLEVTPHVTADGFIGMKIKASNNSPGAGTPPPINMKEATTELSVKNGETTVIGGIYVDNDTETDTGVPFLKDIPLLGWLFKSNSKTKSKSELLIFITPKILS
jgi:type IV pilus assembly protein PilQ